MRRAGLSLLVAGMILLQLEQPLWLTLRHRLRLQGPDSLLLLWVPVCPEDSSKAARQRAVWSKQKPRSTSR